MATWKMGTEHCIEGRCRYLDENNERKEIIVHALTKRVAQMQIEQFIDEHFDYLYSRPAFRPVKRNWRVLYSDVVKSASFTASDWLDDTNE